MDFDSLLKLMLEKKASDLFITRGVPPSLKINGKIIPVGKIALSGHQARELVESVMDDKQRAEFHAHHELNFAIASGHVESARLDGILSFDIVSEGDERRGNLGVVCKAPKHSQTIRLGCSVLRVLLLLSGSALRGSTDVVLKADKRTLVERGEGEWQRRAGHAKRT